MAIELVSFPINSMVISHSYVNVYQRVPNPFLWYCDFGRVNMLKDGSLYKDFRRTPINMGI